MRKWRPTHKAIYVIPEIRGNINSLEVILNRVLPLRIFENQDDIIVFLGDYIDGDENGDKVIDCLINIKEQYKDRAVFLRGDHEDMCLSAFHSDHLFDNWIDNYGISTISSYIKRANLINTSPYAIKRNRLQDIIPKIHLDFMNNLNYYKVVDEYCFLHSGFNTEKPIAENNNSNFIYDLSSSKYVKDCIKNKIEPVFQDKYTYIANGNYMSDKPFISSKYFMLGGNAPRKLFVFELNSMDACAVSYGKSRIYKYKFRTHE
jgi:hypothetical protein